MKSIIAVSNIFMFLKRPYIAHKKFERWELVALVPDVKLPLNIDIKEMTVTLHIFYIH